MCCKTKEPRPIKCQTHSLNVQNTPFAPNLCLLDNQWNLGALRGLNKRLKIIETHFNLIKLNKDY